MPGLEWIGLRLSDLDRFELANRDKFVFRLGEADKQLARNLKGRLTVLQEFDLVQQVKPCKYSYMKKYYFIIYKYVQKCAFIKLELMLEKNMKAELQYLQHIDSAFLSRVYLRAKLSSLLKLNF